MLSPSLRNMTPVATIQTLTNKYGWRCHTLAKEHIAPALHVTLPVLQGLVTSSAVLL
jgi:hypothetical protein